MSNSQESHLPAKMRRCLVRSFNELSELLKFISCSLCCHLWRCWRVVSLLCEVFGDLPFIRKKKNGNYFWALRNLIGADNLETRQVLSNISYNRKKSDDHLIWLGIYTFFESHNSLQVWFLVLYKHAITYYRNLSCEISIEFRLF